MLKFRPGDEYTRGDVQRAAGQEGKGGIWFTGIIPPSAARGDFIIFANIGDTGRTGHDYPNRWEGSRLRWYHQNGSRFREARVQAMLDKSARVHVFWRRSNKNPRFRYAGLATLVEVKKNTSPVEILWSF